MYTAAVLASLLSSALAISITSPPQNYVQDSTQPQRIVWTSVNTDPPTINIELVNFSKFPNFNKTIATNVQTSAGFFVNPANNDDGQTGTGFQINFVGTQGDNLGIVAQSQQFQLVNGGGSSSSASGSSSGTTELPTTTPLPSGTGSAPFPINGTTTGGSPGATGGAGGAGGTSSPSPSNFPGAASGLERSVGAVAAVALGLVAFFA